RSKKTVLSFFHEFSLIWHNKKLSLFFVASIIFSLGNSSDAFLILRAKNLGLTTLMVVLTYVVYNISQTLLATPLGKLSDKIGAKKVFEGGLLIFSLVYFFFGFIKNPIFIWVLFPLYGIYIAATDGVSKAYVAEFITKRESGSYFGLYQSATAVSAFFASWVAGILWYKISPATTFYYGAIMALLAFLMLKFGRLLRKN
ncbi:MAG: major facilitator superfamily MFS_1, partial [uncultured bacterium]